MRKTAAILVTVGVFGALTASAAALGGLNSATLGAEQTIVASCDTDGIDLGYENSYNQASGAYFTDAVTLSGVNDACDGLKFKLTLSDGSSALTEATGTVSTSDGTQRVGLDSPVSAELVNSAALVIAN